MSEQASKKTHRNTTGMVTGYYALKINAHVLTYQNNTATTTLLAIPLCCTIHMVQMNEHHVMLDCIQLHISLTCLTTMC